jgi:hypothetical protein
MSITIINDCHDENAKGRQVARAHALFNTPVNFVGVANDLDAAGSLVDILDAGRGTRHVVLVNVAPRAQKSWWLSHDFPHRTNGTPFCYFHVGDATVLASIDGYTLSLIKKLALTDVVRVFNYESAVEILADRGLIARPEIPEVCSTQFRSFNFLPRAARLLGGPFSDDTAPG